MEIKITTLAENSAAMGCLAEWGLSMFIEVEGVNILFDTGIDIAVVHNAQIFGIDLKKVDRIVLSHGHRDHTGGLRKVLMRMGKDVEVIAHPDIWALKYTRWQNRTEHFSGIYYRRELLESLGARFKLTGEPVQITKHVTTTGEIPMLTDYEEIDEGLLVKEDSKQIPDRLADDLALVIDAEYGLVVILGCAHRGIVNTLKQAKKVTGKDLIYAAIGGTHLIHASPERWKKTAADLKDMGVQYLGVSHCTGFRASAYLAREFGERFFLNSSGSRWTLPFKEE